MRESVSAVSVEALQRRGRLDHVTFDLSAGALALIGPNGAGKSTVLHVLVGRIRSHGGAATLFGHKPRSAAAARLRAYVPQQIAFPSHLRVREVLAAAVKAKGCASERAEAAAVRMGIGGFLLRRAGTLSGGMTQRLALAAALMDEPPVWLLDEPASALDGGGLERLADWAREHVRSGGTLVVSAHRPEEVEAFAAEALLLVRGRVVGRVPVQELFDDRLVTTGGRVPLPEGTHVERSTTLLLRRVLGGDE
ncbi:MAG: ABC transporter ATP-binding protein [Trueperaceae bacterium]|nr:ABC transporter ATP-binding protein [Trueperaceae bacterium]MCO5175336.1 ABC transporter ATP-binding protein [Trueperaceae bacterium]